MANLAVSIPQSEFCWLKPGPARRVGHDPAVSIPQSEFCWLKQQVHRLHVPAFTGFNSPIGILLVEARISANTSMGSSCFNSPIGILLVEA